MKEYIKLECNSSGGFELQKYLLKATESWMDNLFAVASESLIVKSVPIILIHSNFRFDNAFISKKSIFIVNCYYNQLITNKKTV
jgi:hypothetical protein